jgi:exodeoxyribonuclease VII small subunit
MAKKKATDKAPSFENALARLEEIVSELEGGELALEKALELFEEGVTLGKSCGAQLEEAEKKIVLLVEKADGSLAEEALDEPPGDGDSGVPF